MKNFNRTQLNHSPSSSPSNLSSILNTTKTNNDHHHHHHHHHHHQSSSFTPAERLTRADDLMSDILDCFLWPTIHHTFHPSKRTIKFTSDYRRPRSLNLNEIKHIIRSVQTGQLRNLTEATTLIKQLPAITSYMANAEPPRLGKHIGLYLQLFLPKCGIRFFETDRYNQRRPTLPTDPSQPIPINSIEDSKPHSTQSSGSRTKRKRSSIRSKELRDLLSSSDSPLHSSFSTTPNSSPAAASPSPSRFNSTHRLTEFHPTLTNLTHLAVFATRDYSPNDIIIGCEGSFADLTEQEDLKLRSNAHLPLHSSPNLASQSAVRQSTDFSHIVNSRGKFQVFCGPARFVNHDCNNNVELLREGFTIKFKVTKPIKAGQEILTSYGMNYFGEKNCECMCATCERNGRGFYSPLHPIPGPIQPQDSLDNSTTHPPIDSNDPSSIKQENQDPNPLTGPSTDTDLSSLIDSSDGTLSRASHTPASDRSPIQSYSNTPSQVRRQLALASRFPTLLPPPSTDSPPNSRSSSTRRQTRIRSPQDPPNSNALIPFVSPVKFLPTNDLTQTIPSNEAPKHTTNALEFETLSTCHSAKLDSSGSGLDINSLPIKRKTYWITTKQKQLGLVPWESSVEPSSATHSPPPPPPPTSSSSSSSLPSRSVSQQLYSPITPSLLGPRRRDSVERSSRQRKSTSVNTTSPTTGANPISDSKKLPMRSYWVSTKEKQLGILPWESNSKTVNDSPDSSLTKASEIKATARSTRASRRASEGTPSLIGFPTAPRGSKLSYRVFEDGTEEAKLLNTAIGRELLGFRPRLNKRKKPLDSGGQAVVEIDDNSHQQGVIDIKKEEDDPQPRPAEPEPSSQVDNELAAVIGDDSMVGIDPLDEISSFLLTHPVDPEASMAPINNTTTECCPIPMGVAETDSGVEKVRRANDLSLLLQNSRRSDDQPHDQNPNQDVSGVMHNGGMEIDLSQKLGVILPTPRSSPSTPSSDSTSLITTWTSGESIPRLNSTLVPVDVRPKQGINHRVGDDDGQPSPLCERSTMRGTKVVTGLGTTDQKSRTVIGRSHGDSQPPKILLEQDGCSDHDDGDDGLGHRKKRRLRSMTGDGSKQQMRKMMVDHELRPSTITTFRSGSPTKVELIDPNHSDPDHLSPRRLLVSNESPNRSMVMMTSPDDSRLDKPIVPPRAPPVTTTMANDPESSTTTTTKGTTSDTNHPLWISEILSNYHPSSLLPTPLI